MPLDCSGWGGWRVLTGHMLSSKVFPLKPFRIIAGLLKNVLHLVLIFFCSYQAFWMIVKVKGDFEPGYICCQSAFGATHNLQIAIVVIFKSLCTL